MFYSLFSTFLCKKKLIKKLGLRKTLHFCKVCPSTFPTVSVAKEDPRRRGRDPPGRRWRKWRLQRKTLTPCSWSSETVPDCASYKKWSRPACSKKKAQIHKSSSRDLADPQFDSQFYDQEDVCNVCGFQLNQPTKADKPVISCNICAQTMYWKIWRVVCVPKIKLTKT